MYYGLRGFNPRFEGVAVRGGAIPAASDGGWSAALSFLGHRERSSHVRRCTDCERVPSPVGRTTGTVCGEMEREEWRKGASVSSK